MNDTKSGTLLLIFDEIERKFKNNDIVNITLCGETASGMSTTTAYLSEKTRSIINAQAG